MRKLLSTTIAAAAVAFAAPALAGGITIDLTHPIPTFHPAEGDPMTPDLDKPWLDSVPIPSFGQQAVFSISGNSPPVRGISISAGLSCPSITAPTSIRPATTSTTRAQWRRAGRRRESASSPIS